MNTIWVVEMLMDNGDWQPCVGCGLTKKAALEEKLNWNHANPDDMFRVTKYTPE